MTERGDEAGLVARALHGNGGAIRDLVDRLTPVIQARVGRARALRSWDRARGLSLANFVGLVTERHVTSLFRNRGSSPWTEEPVEDSDLERAAGACQAAELRVSSREFLAKLIDRLSSERNSLAAIAFTGAGVSLFTGGLLLVSPVPQGGGSRAAISASIDLRGAF